MTTLNAVPSLYPLSDMTSLLSPFNAEALANLTFFSLIISTIRPVSFGGLAHLMEKERQLATRSMSLFLGKQAALSLSPYSQVRQEGLSNCLK